MADARSPAIRDARLRRGLREKRGFARSCHFTKRERALVSVSMTEPSRPIAVQRVRRILVDFTVMTVIGVILALIGPFGSFQDPLAIRLIVWVGLSYAGYAIYSPMGAIVERLHTALDLPKLGLWVASVLVATVPMTLVVWSVGQVARPEFRFPDAQAFLMQYAYVLVIGGGVTVLFNLIELPGGKNAQPPAPVVDRERSPAPGVPFLDRLPPQLGSDLIALEMEDHYVRAHTALGSELILMRMRDAVAELGGIEGEQVHRSWWVARGAVESVERDGRNVRLVLANGLEAPVSRANVQPLRDAGWL